MAKSSVTIRLKEFSEQTINPNIRRIIGLLPARFIVGIIDELDLEANPRNSRLGAVTSGIIDSIRQDEDSSARLFPFKTKGILLAASSYVELIENDSSSLLKTGILREFSMEGTTPLQSAYTYSHRQRKLPETFT